MKPIMTIAAACAALAVTAAFADHTPSHCGKSAAADGMRARINTISQQVDRIEWTTDPAQQRALIDLNMKHMSEAMGQLRRRNLSTGCQIELMSTMLEALMRQQQVAHIADAR